MNRLLQIILGIDRPKGAEAAGPSRLELSALPQGATAAALIVAAIAFLCVVWWLYRHERPRSVAVEARTDGGAAGADAAGSRGHAGRAGA